MKQMIREAKRLVVKFVNTLMVLAGLLFIGERAMERLELPAAYAARASENAPGEEIGTEQEVSLSPEQLADRAALLRGINPALVRAVMHVESRGKIDAVSIKGAVGLLQVMPANYKRCGLEHPGKLWEPEINVACGTQILAEELKNHKLDDALRVYNGGPKALKRGFKESEQYVHKVVSQLMVELDKEVRG